MAIKATFDIKKLQREIEKRVKVDITDDVLEAIYLACQEIVNGAKMNDTYKDQTNYLRSSIGFVIFNNGKMVHQYFQQEHKNSAGTKGGQGAKRGLQDAKQAAKEHTQGIVACIVAGADYALAVESKGYDVLTDHANKAPEIIIRRLKEIESALAGTPPHNGGEQLSLF